MTKQEEEGGGALPITHKIFSNVTDTGLSSITYNHAVKMYSGVSLEIQKSCFPLCMCLLRGIYHAASVRQNNEMSDSTKGQTVTIMRKRNKMLFFRAAGSR